MRKVLLTLALALLGLFLMGNPGCEPEGDDDATGETPAEPTPEDIAKTVEAGLDLATTSITFAEQAATIVDPPEFHPCMIATGSLAGIALAKASVPAIEAEATSPDGKLTITGGPIDFTRCMDMVGKPDPWPPSEPDPNVEAMVKTGVPLGISVAKTFIEPKIPTEGEECIKGRVAMALMDSIGQVVVTTVLDGVNGKDATTIPEFTVDWSGCGLTFEEEAAPVEDPAPVE
jgi:hypothetical protein